MLQQSCLYARGITPVFTGGVGDGSVAAVDAMGVDSNRYTSFVVDGHALAYVCGYGSVYMNGSFIRSDSPMVTDGYGWMGNYRNATINNMGALRQFLTERAYNSNITAGSTMLVISDGASVDDESAMESWGQLVHYLERMPLDMLSHTWDEINAGAYGYDGTYKYFQQWSCVMLLLSSSGQSMPTAMLNALREAHRNGVSLIVLQKGPYEGNVNFNAIFSPLGITSNGAANVVATQAARSKSINAFGDHVGWLNVPQLSNQKNYRVSAAYQFNSGAGAAGPGSIGGQAGVWRQMYCGQVDIPDDVILDPEIIYRDPCCVEIGSAYGVNFDVTTYPYKPDDWAARMAAGDVSVNWSNDNGASLQARSSVFSHIVGYQRTLDTGDVGYTYVNGVYYRDSRGFNVYKIRKSDQVLVDRRAYDIHVSAEGTAPGTTNAANMAAFLNSIGADHFVYVVSYDTANVNRTQGGLAGAMYRIGASRRVYEGGQYQYRGCYCCFGLPGVGEGNAPTEMYYGPQSSDPDSYFSVGFAYDSYGNQYCCGTDRNSAMSLGITGLYESTKSAHLSYYKVLGGMDGAQTYGMKHTVTIRDNRFKKLPMYETKSFVVSVTNPCFPVPKVQSHDWVRRVAMAGTETVYYPFADQYEYLVTTTDDSGPNELCTSHLMMNWEMFDGVGGASAYNEAGPDHLTRCGGDRSNPGSLYFAATGGSRVWQIYERKYGLINDTPGRDTNDWQIVWKWTGVGSQGHNIQIDAGYEYIVFAYDRYGDLELAERHFIVPEAANLPQWAANLYNADFSNSTLFTVDRALRCNAYCTKTSDNGTQNGIMMIIRRPLFMSTGSADRTGWQLTYNANGPSIPTGRNVPIYFESDYQYMVLCATGNGAVSTHHFNGWNKTFDVPGWDSDAGIEAESCGRCQWTHNRQQLLTSERSLSTNAKEYLSSSYAPTGVFQVYRRPILCWEPDEI
ncbi:hypothetical protein pEaSNUABM25_00112 [Erwinia phage pEa_SNUABM_25]|nr:hypothetical protein pEaSNUABM25_00112 [Erwinia phage pEa_SNUABM_25]